MVRDEAEQAQRISDKEDRVRGVWLNSLECAQGKTPASRADARKRKPLAEAALDNQVTG